MVRIRLRKVGSKAQTSFRLVAADREHPRDGRFIEEIGYYNPRTNPATIVVDEAKAFQWLKNGAQPSESAAKVLKVTGTLERFARFKAGEAVETLVAEAEAATKARNANRSTTAASAPKGPSKKKAKKAAESA